MTQYPAPPEGFEVVENEDDQGIANEENLRFRAPDGTVFTVAEMIEAGHFATAD